MIPRPALLAVTIIAQIALALLLGFGGAMALGIGDGWELIFMPVANAAGIVLGGLPLGMMGGERPNWLGGFAAALAGAAAGALLLYVLPPTGFRGMLLPIGLGLLVFHLHASRRTITQTAGA